MASTSNNRLDEVVQRNNKRLRTAVHPSPYAHPQEHTAVGRALLTTVRDDDHHSSIMMSVPQALEHVHAWRTRIPRIPHAVESTAALAQFLYRLNEEQQSTTTITSMELRLGLSCAILRAVNGLADTLQQQHATACSVAVLCQELGIPSWLVDIRHESTHNQLPPLPTLKLAATSLLQYFAAVYWDPLESSREELYQDAMELLRAYDVLLEKGAQEEHLTKPEISVAMGSSDSEEEEDIEALERSLLSIPGTNANRFSLLLQDNRKSKKRTAAAVEAEDTSNNQTNKQKSSPPPNRKKKARSATAIANEQRATQSSCARQFVKAKIPVDIKSQAALDFLLGGVLLHSSNNGLLDASLVDKYSVLLVTLGGTWPGFLHALLVCCVDRVLSPSLHAHSNVALLWIRYFLSRTFLGQMDNSMNNSRSSNKTNGVSKEIAPLATLKTFEFPLNSLCDRCDAVAVTNPAAAELGKLFADILGTERCANHGVDLSAFQQASPKTVSNNCGAVKPVAKVATSSSASTAPMSLAAMEAFLADGDAGASAAEGGDNESSSDGDDEPAPTPWARCTTWDPCAIGTLPGFGA